MFAIKKSSLSRITAVLLIGVIAISCCACSTGQQGILSSTQQVTSETESVSQSSTIEGTTDGESSKVASQIDEINEKLTVFENDSDYASAITYLEDKLSEVDYDAELTSKLDLYKDEYRKSIIDEASNIYDSDGYEAAIEVINNGLEILPDDDELNSEKEKYEDKAPDLLENITVIEGDIDVKTKTQTDILGNEYLPDNLCSVNHGWGSDGYNLLYLNGNYTKITGRIANGGADYSAEILIYGSSDEELEQKTLLYERKFKNTTEPQDISIDVSGYEYLIIEVGKHGYFYLSNFEFYK